MCGYDIRAQVNNAWVYRAQSYTPTANSLRGNGKDSYKYRSWRKTWEGLFGPWLKAIPVADKRRRVIIERLYGRGKRPYDRINFAAGQKPLLDTLVNFGALYDDSIIWCQDNYRQTKSEDGIDYVTVTIEELG